jgi:hypothetical protein
MHIANRARFDGGVHFKRKSKLQFESWVQCHHQESSKPLLPDWRAQCSLLRLLHGSYCECPGCFPLETWGSHARLRSHSGRQLHWKFQSRKGIDDDAENDGERNKVGSKLLVAREWHFVTSRRSLGAYRGWYVATIIMSKKRRTFHRVRCHHNRLYFTSE